MKKVSRRTFFSSSLGAAAALSLPGAANANAGQQRSEDLQNNQDGPDIIDTNVNLFDWPFRKLKYGNTKALVEKLRNHRITQAWAGNYEALFHKDISGVNARLAEECRVNGQGMLLPQHEIGGEVTVPVAEYWSIKAHTYWDLQANSWLQVGGGLVQLRLEVGRGALAHDQAVVDDRQPVAELVGLLEVLRGEEDRGAALVDAADLVPDREPAALQQRPGLIRENFEPASRLVRNVNRRERRTHAARCERACVAVRQHSRVRWHQRRAVRANRPAARHVVVVNLSRGRLETRRELVVRRVPEVRVVLVAHGRRRFEVPDER